MIKRAYILAIALVFAISAIATASSWEADKAHSSVGFKVKHLMISNVHGNFNDFTINLDYDENDVTRSQLNVSIDLASVNTDNQKRDDHLKNADFFDVENFPTMTFVSKRISKTSDGLVIIGDFTLHGVTKEVTFKVEGPTQQVMGPMGHTMIGASATAKINRTDFGLTWNMPMKTGGLVVGEEVTILIEVELMKQTSSAMR